MVNCTVLVSKGVVFRELELFLRSRAYKNIEVNSRDNIITGERRDSIFGKKYSVQFAVKAKSEAVTDIEITVNPRHAVPTKGDMDKENKIRSRVYFYF